MRKKRRQIDMPPSYVIEHLDEAIEKHWVRVHYQPIVRTISGQLCAMEGLARWDDPNWGFLTPPFFISILEQHNLIHKLDAFLIEEVCRNHARIRKAGLPSVPVSLNLSRLDFINCDIFAIVERAVRKYNVPRDLLHLEIVENILTDRNKKIGEVLDRFRAAGYEIWMDDFGSGYSSLKFLKDQRFDLLKMDMAFLKSDTQRARDIIISIISMDKRIGGRSRRASRRRSSSSSCARSAARKSRATISDGRAPTTRRYTTASRRASRSNWAAGRPIMMPSWMSTSSRGMRCCSSSTATMPTTSCLPTRRAASSSGRGMRSGTGSGKKR